MCYNNVVHENFYGEDMKKLLTDLHTHSTFSHDGKMPLQQMLDGALEKGFTFYGASEHFDYDIFFGGKNLEINTGVRKIANIDAESYFHTARHLQDDYAGCLNFLVGAEYSFDEQPQVIDAYIKCDEKYKPDYVINSIHSLDGLDFYYCTIDPEYQFKDKQTTYGLYLDAVRKSLDAPYPYDIVGHFGYLTRYDCYRGGNPDRSLSLAEFGKEIDDILKTIIKKDKILEINSSNKGGVSPFLPSNEILKRYFELGGRKVTFGSDAHESSRIGDKREEVVALLKEIGFTHITVPCRGEHIKVEI